MSILLRRGAYALSKPLTNMGRVGSVRLYAVGKESAQQQFEHHHQVEIGDLVTYTDTKGSKSAGYIQKIFEESGPHANKGKMAEIQNYHTKAVTYNDLSNVQSVARKHEDYKVNTKAGNGTQTTANTAKPTPTTTTTNAAAPKTAPQTHATTPGATQNKTAQQTHATTPGATQNKTAHPAPATNASQNKTAQTTTGATASQVANAQADIAQQHLKDSAQKLNEQLKSDSSPLNADFAPGDIVRYRVAQNFTAAVVLELIYGITHDEHGGFHGATKENPMAKLENLWTKNISYHHLNVLEHVKRARDVTPGRFAEQEYAVYDKQ